MFLAYLRVIFKMGHLESTFLLWSKDVNKPGIDTDQLSQTDFYRLGRSFTLDTFNLQLQQQREKHFNWKQTNFKWLSAKENSKVL